jgi:hypothetical protein
VKPSSFVSPLKSLDMSDMFYLYDYANKMSTGYVIIHRKAEKGKKQTGIGIYFMPLRVYVFVYCLGGVNV